MKVVWIVGGELQFDDIPPKSDKSAFFPSSLGGSPHTFGLTPLRYVMWGWDYPPPLDNDWCAEPYTPCTPLQLDLLRLHATAMVKLGLRLNR